MSYPGLATNGIGVNMETSMKGKLFIRISTLLCISYCFILKKCLNVYSHVKVLQVINGLIWPTRKKHLRIETRNGYSFVRR